MTEEEIHTIRVTLMQLYINGRDIYYSQYSLIANPNKYMEVLLACNDGCNALTFFKNFLTEEKITELYELTLTATTYLLDDYTH